MVSKCRNNAPPESPARRVITAAEARAYPTSMMVAMLASSSRATVSSRRCCWVLAMSGGHGEAGAVAPAARRNLPDRVVCPYPARNWPLRKTTSPLTAVARPNHSRFRRANPR